MMRAFTIYKILILDHLLCGYFNYFFLVEIIDYKNKNLVLLRPKFLKEEEKEKENS
jgi:hypothetical protein